MAAKFLAFAFEQCRNAGYLLAYVDVGHRGDLQRLVLEDVAIGIGLASSLDRRVSGLDQGNDLGPEMPDHPTDPAVNRPRRLSMIDQKTVEHDPRIVGRIPDFPCHPSVGRKHSYVRAKLVHRDGNEVA